MRFTSPAAALPTRWASHRLVCSEIFGGIGAVDQEVSTAGLTASISSIAVDGAQGGDMLYLSYCTNDFLSRIAIADVRGHGESVTRVSSWVYAALRAQMNTLTGDRVLSDLNALIHSRGLQAMTTAAVLSYDRRQRCLYFCYAGHPPAMICHYSAGWRRLENTEEQPTSNLPLGVMATTIYEQGHIMLTPGDRLVMFTDGLLDAEDSHGEPFGDQRLGQVLDAANPVSVAALKHDLLGHLFEHRGNRAPEDDVTLLVAEVL